MRSTSNAHDGKNERNVFHAEGGAGSLTWVKYSPYKDERAWVVCTPG